MRLNIIHDNRRSERFEPLMNELFVHDIKFQIWEPVEAPTVVQSINKSHKKIVQWAKDMKLPMVAIGEDDLCFAAKDGWKYFLNLMPEEFDLYLSCTYIVPKEQKQLVGFHCYVVHEKFYDKFLSVPDDVHIDTAISGMGGDFKFAYPFPCLQREGWSANNKAIVNYNSILREEDIYRG